MCKSSNYHTCYIKQAGKIQAEYESELTSVAAYANYFCRMGTLPRQGNLPPLEEIFRTQELEVRESQPVDLNIAKSLNLQEPQVQADETKFDRSINEEIESARASVLSIEGGRESTVLYAFVFLSGAVAGAFLANCYLQSTFTNLRNSNTKLRRPEL